MESSKIVIFDLDGTLADIEHRRHLVHGKNKNWPKFFRECVNDKVKGEVLEILLSLKARGHIVYIFSGRSGAVKEETIKWLKDNNIPYEGLIMRRKDDYRPDDILKKEMLYNFLKQNNKTKADILCIFDDRDKVVKMWREEGLTCCQVAPGDF